MNPCHNTIVAVLATFVGAEAQCMRWFATCRLFEFHGPGPQAMRVQCSSQRHLKMSPTFSFTSLKGELVCMPRGAVFQDVSSFVPLATGVAKALQNLKVPLLQAWLRALDFVA